MHTSSCDSMLSLHQLRRACGESHERYCDLLAMYNIKANIRMLECYPMIAADEEDYENVSKDYPFEKL